MKGVPRELAPFVKALVVVGRALRERGIDFALIGSLVIPLVYKISWPVHDVDLFILNKDVLAESELFEEIARENDWDFGMEAYGTAYYEVLVDDNIVRVDLMENVLDVYVPLKLFESAKRIRVEDVEVKCLRLEDLIALKAREASKESEEDIRKIAEILADPRYNISVDKEYMRSVIQLFPEEEREDIVRRIERNGIYLD